MRSLRNVRILIVEDDATQVLLLRESLSEVVGEGTTFAEATRLAEALALVERERIDVALLDLGLPDSTGLASLTALKRRVPELPVVVLTGIADDAFGLAALKAGAQDYLIKGSVEPLVLARSLRYAIERAKIENELARERQLLRTVVNTIPDLIWFKDANGVYLSANPMFERFVGKTEGELLGKTDYDLVDGELADFFRAMDRVAVQAGKAITNEEEVTFADDGHRAVLETIKTPVRDAQGRLLGVLGVAREITERVRFTDELRESRTRLQTALEGGGIGTWTYDVTTDQSWWDDSVLKLFGRELSDADGGRRASFIEWIVPEDQPRIAAAAERCVREGTSFAEEFRYRRPDGTVLWFSGRGRMECDANGAPRRMVGAIVDITERKRADEALRSSEERFRELADNIREVFWLTDIRKSRIIYVSPAYEAIWGRSLESLYASPRDWTDAIVPEDRDRIWEAAMSKQALGTYDEEYRILRPDGEIRWVRDRAFPVRDPHGNLIRIAGVAEDITARRQLESQIRESQKMESIALLAGGVAHDFNNLLTVIVGNNELLQMEMPEGSEAAAYAEQIQEATARAASLTRQLLAFSRREVLEPRVLDVNQVVHDMERMLARLLGEDIILTTELASGLGPVFVDPGHLEQVIMNLAVNARDAMPKGGRLLLATRGVVVEEHALADHPGASPGKYVQLLVRDTGVGMSPEQRQRIFEPFFTTKAQGRGTGLGLAVVHGIVTQSGGHVDVHSAVGEGTTFTICLPEATAASSPRETAPPPAHPQGSETILLVEDDGAVRTTAARILGRNGYVVVVAASAAEALAHIERGERVFDLIITDVVMPEMGGGELARELEQRLPGAKILFTSGFTDDAVVRHGVYQAEVPFLQKPYTSTSLIAKVREVLANV
ncbi:MAG: PAS domain S-box protein [bacterium]